MILPAEWNDESKLASSAFSGLPLVFKRSSSRIVGGIETKFLKSGTYVHNRALFAREASLRCCGLSWGGPPISYRLHTHAQKEFQFWESACTTGKPSGYELSIVRSDVDAGPSIALSR
jgi:hypothetical protein